MLQGLSQTPGSGKGGIPGQGNDALLETTAQGQGLRGCAIAEPALYGTCKMVIFIQRSARTKLTTHLVTDPPTQLDTTTDWKTMH